MAVSVLERRKGQTPGRPACTLPDTNSWRDACFDAGQRADRDSRRMVNTPASEIPIYAFRPRRTAIRPTIPELNSTSVPGMGTLEMGCEVISETTVVK